MNEDDRSGLGCLWLIGWTFMSIYVYGVVLLGFESNDYPETDATTWKLAPEEIVLLGVWLLFWLSGISVWHTLRWLRRSRSDPPSFWRSVRGFALIWAGFLCLLALSLANAARPLGDSYQPPDRWLWFLDAPALFIVLAGFAGSLWALGVAAWQAIRSWLWRIIDARGRASPPA